MKTLHEFMNISSRFSHFLLLACLLGFAHQEAGAYSLRQFSSKDGLSNSAILSICQDNSGLLWIGTCDGLNVFDGTTFRRYKPADSDNSISGNLIGNMMEGGKDIFWIQTNYGLDRFDTQSKTVQNFTSFRDTQMAKSADNDVFIVDVDGFIYCFCEGDEEFRKLDVEKVDFNNLKQMVFDSRNVLWLFSSDGDNRSYTVDKSDGTIKLISQDYFDDSETILWASAEGDLLYFIDHTHALYEYDLKDRRKYYIADLEAEVNRRGAVSSIIKQKDDYYIGFKSSGLIDRKSVV